MNRGAREFFAVLCLTPFSMIVFDHLLEMGRSVHALWFRIRIFHCLTCSGVSEWASERTSKRCKRTSERTSETPSTSVSIFGSSKLLCRIIVHVQFLQMSGIGNPGVFFNAWPLPFFFFSLVISFVLSKEEQFISSTYQSIFKELSSSLFRTLEFSPCPFRASRVALRVVKK